MGLRDALARAAFDVRGLDSLIVGIRRPRPASADAEVPAAIISLWRDVESMVRAIGYDEADRFLDARLHLTFRVDRAVHYETVGRAFAGLPPETTAYLRMTTFRAGPNEEARLIETLRTRQQRLVGMGLIASHLGRRVVGTDCEAITVGVWPDLAAVGQEAGASEEPLFADEIAGWSDRMRFESFDGIEIAPRLPAASGPPVLVVDEELTIVDITATAAAILGWAAADLIGRSLVEISRRDPVVLERDRRTLEREGFVAGEGSWKVQEEGQVFVRYVAARDRPIAGRHAVLVHRWNEPPPTREELEAALGSAFGSGTG